MTCCGNLSNYIEIFKCCDWQFIPELYLIGSFQKTVFFLQTQFQQCIYTQIRVKMMQGLYLSAPALSWWYYIKMFALQRPVTSPTGMFDEHLKENTIHPSIQVVYQWLATCEPLWPHTAGNAAGSMCRNDCICSKGYFLFNLRGIKSI